MKKLTIIFTLLAALYSTGSMLAGEDTFTYYQDDTVGRLHVTVNDTDYMNFDLEWSNATGWQWTIHRNDNNSPYADTILNVLLTGEHSDTLPEEFNVWLANYSQFNTQPTFTIYLPVINN